MASFSEAEATINGNVIHITICPTKISTNKEKKYKDKKMMEITTRFCALLNSGGGKLVLSYEKSPPRSHIMDCVRMIEQRIDAFMGSVKMVSKISKKTFPNCIVFLVMASVDLITLNYNLYLPTTTQVLAVPPTELLAGLKMIVNGENDLVCKEITKHKMKFVKGQYVGFEEDVDVQFKRVKDESAKCVTLADRLVSKSNKIDLYVSAFANHNGGHIYYGIDDIGIVVGEKVTNIEDIVKKVTKAINKVIWSQPCHKPKRGREWEISFEPVKDNKGQTIPSTFVIVIDVARCFGGVFVNAPESYHMVRGEVEKMNFEVWKDKVFTSSTASKYELGPDQASTGELEINLMPQTISHEKLSLDESSQLVPSVDPSPCLVIAQANVPGVASIFEEDPNLDVSNQLVPSVDSSACLTTPQASVARVSLVFDVQPSEGPMHLWSSTKSRDDFVRFTTTMVQLRNDDKMLFFDRLSNWVMENYPNSNACLIAKAEQVAVAYKNHHFKKADSLLANLDELVEKSTKDAPVFKRRVLYLMSRIARARKNFKESYEMAVAGLQRNLLISPGFITVWSYMNAAFLANVLFNQEHDPDKRDDLRRKERQYLEWAQRDSLTLKHLPDETVDLKQKLHIYQAFSALQCPLTGEASDGATYVTRQKDLGNASQHLTEVYKLDLEVRKLSHFRKCQYLLAESDLLRQRAANQIMQRFENRKRSLGRAKEAHTLAKEHHFAEMVNYSQKRLANLTEDFIRSHVSIKRNFDKKTKDDDSVWMKDLGMDYFTE